MMKGTKKVYSGSGPVQGTMVGSGEPSKVTILTPTVATDSWAEWDIPAAARKLVIKHRNEDSDLYISDTVAGTEYFTLKAGEVLTLGEIFGQAGPSPMKIWLKGEVAGEVEAMIWSEEPSP